MTVFLFVDDVQSLNLVHRPFGCVKLYRQCNNLEQDRKCHQSNTCPEQHIPKTAAYVVLGISDDHTGNDQEV